MEPSYRSQLTLWMHRLGQAARRGWLLWILPLALGLALRFWALDKLFNLDGDPLIYGSLAKNLLLHGHFGFTGAEGEIIPTLIRLPGYPLFLAACFRLFGIENYFAAACVQIALDLAGCLLLAGFVRRVAPAVRGAALITLWLACLCPFTASYTAVPLAETPTLFSISLALWAAAGFRRQPGWGNALLFTFAITWAALLRPDGALVGMALAPALLLAPPRASLSWAKLARMAAACTLLALAPFTLWTVRNWRVFHVFEPLAPRLAVDPGESPNLGWEHWVKSWCLDFASTYQIYWNVPGDKLEIGQLPARAFDSPAQYAETAALAADYNNNGMEITPAIDARFEHLAQERIAAHPLRYYLWLPLGRLADMWLRPRVENLPIDLDWWVYEHHGSETIFCWAYAALNALLLLLGLAGLLCLRPPFWRAMLAYLLLRSIMLLTVQAPETRYTLECFPMLFAAAGLALAAAIDRMNARIIS
jgi:hypothetical protein